MGYFPFFMDITDKKGVILGGGRVAARKIGKLLAFSPVLVCVAEEFCEDILGQAREVGEQRLRLCCRSACEEDLTGAAFVIAATDDESVNGWAAAWCRERNIPVNVVDDREKCTFFFPALVREGPVTVGIASDGQSPSASGWLRRLMEQQMPEGMGQAVERLGRLRDQLKEILPQPKQRAECLEQLFAFCAQRDFAVTEEELQQVCSRLIREKIHAGEAETQDPAE